MNWDITQPAQSLQWWGAFTDVKHNRYEQLKQAKQGECTKYLGSFVFDRNVVLEENH